MRCPYILVSPYRASGECQNERKKATYVYRHAEERPQACGGIRKFSVLNEQPAMLLYWEERPRPTWGGARYFLVYEDSILKTRLSAPP